MRRIAIIFACAGALVAAAPASAEVRELGVSPEAPLVEPSCPVDCQAIGRVSGYPVQIGALKNPFLINEPGTVVAFTVRLGKPDAEQTTFFSNLFGGQAQVRLAVLKPARTKRRHRLVSQSEVVNVHALLRLDADVRARKADQGRRAAPSSRSRSRPGSPRSRSTSRRTSPGASRARTATTPRSRPPSRR